MDEFELARHARAEQSIRRASLIYHETHQTAVLPRLVDKLRAELDFVRHDSLLEAVALTMGGSVVAGGLIWIISNNPL